MDDARKLLLSIVVGVTSIACGDGHPPPVRSSPPDRSTIAAEDPAEAPVQEPAAEPDEERCDEAFRIESARLLSLGPDRRHRIGANSFAFPELTHPDERVQRLLDERIAELGARALGLRVGDAPDPSPSRGCAVWLATSDVVSVNCYTTQFDGAARGATASRGFHLSIDGGEVRELALAELFVPGTDMNAIVREVCENETDDADGCGAREQPVISLDDAGLVFEWNEGVELHLPYCAVGDRLLDTGPLARSLSDAPP